MLKEKTRVVEKIVWLDWINIYDLDHKGDYLTYDAIPWQVIQSHSRQFHWRNPVDNLDSNRMAKNRFLIYLISDKDMDSAGTSSILSGIIFVDIHTWSAVACRMHLEWRDEWQLTGSISDCKRMGVRPSRSWSGVLPLTALLSRSKATALAPAGPYTHPQILQRFWEVRKLLRLKSVPSEKGINCIKLVPYEKTVIPSKKECLSLAN